MKIEALSMIMISL